MLCKISQIGESLRADVIRLAEVFKAKRKVDAYFLKVPENDTYREKIYEIDKVYWLNQFSKTKKMGRRKAQYDKGFPRTIFTVNSFLSY